MSGLLGSLVSSVAKNAMGGGEQESGGVGGMLGGVIASQMDGNSGGGLGSVLGSVLGGGEKSGGNQGMLMAVLMPMVLKWIQGKGGLSGALSQVQDMGLMDQASSWMSAEQENVNLDESQVSELFGADEISKVASQAGVEPSMVSQGLGSLLPEVMNKLTPKGGMENEEEADQEIGSILSQLGGLL